MKKILCILLTLVTVFGCACVCASSAGAMKLTDATYPTEIVKGNTFSVYGIITSEGTITSVTVSAIKSNGEAAFSYTGKPGAKTYNLHNIDYLMTFSKLDVGEYTYKIVASDTYSKDVVLLEKKFKVVAVYTPESEMTPVKWKIIDISKWNEFTSWDSVAKEISGAIVRIGYRTTGSHAVSVDPKFESFYKEAKKRDMHVGCYFFSAALTADEAIEEANYVLSWIKKYNCSLDMPVYFDMETDDQVKLSAAAATKVARAFCKTISDAGYFPGIYCNKYFARDELNASQLNDISFWIAEYASSCTYTGNYGMWQYSEKGKVTGMKGNVDLSYCYYDYPSYIKSKGLNGFAGNTTPKYEFVLKDGNMIDESNKIIWGIGSGIKEKDFTENYVSASSDITVSYTNTVGGNIATGTKIVLKSGETELAAYTISVIGDVDCNASINSADALAVLETAVGKRTLNNIKTLSADVNKDNKINSTDALDILRIAVGIY